MAKITVDSALRLYELLKGKYGTRFQGDPIAALRGDLYAQLDTRKFFISFGADKFLVITTLEEAKDMLDELRPLLEKAMGNNPPICRYDLEDAEMENGLLPTMEWDIVDPEKRIKNVVNGGAFNSYSKLHNIELFGNRNIADYVDPEEQRKNSEEKTRIYGVYPGSISDLEAVHNANPVTLYFMIDALSSYVWACRHEMRHGRMPRIDLTQEQYALEYLVYQTSRFGVQLNEPEIGKHVAATDSYWQWFNFYDTHFKKTLTSEELLAFMTAQKEGKDVSEFMPKGSWNDAPEQPVSRS